MSGVRRIKDLKWVEVSKTNPFPAPRRLKGSKAAGIAFERKFGKALPGLLQGTPFHAHSVHPGIWLEFEDGSGKGFAQPDFFLLPPEGDILQPQYGIIFETKLSINTRGWFQLEKLYRPLLRKLYGVDFKLVLVCKNLRPGFSEYPLLDCIDTLTTELPEKSIWQWL